ncbi:phospholipase D family protein (plasmid) [Tunturibacter empetritectus]|uniref:Phospholipase D family protein n=1 Tax=Tunturiibacter empetritectus TaxID=3069691 RepID=A0AAU7ZIN6_9BACT
MSRLFSNGPLKDFVINPYGQMVQDSTRLWIAAPYVTQTQELVQAAKKGKTVYLLVGLNSTTTPEALASLHELPNCAVRYFTHRFHAKVYLFDQEALVGSSNLTDGGLQSNREATMYIDDTDELDELRALYSELWDSAHVLTTETLSKFTLVRKLMPKVPHLDPRIENAVGRAEPINSNVNSLKKTTQSIFLEQLRREVYEQYRPSFTEVTRLLEANQFRRKELEDVGTANETNRFLNWVRLTYAPGLDSWEQAPLRSEEERRTKILQLGKEWTETDQDKIP